MEELTRDSRLHPAWWALIVLLVITAFVGTTSLVFSGAFEATIPIEVTSDRAGLVMETGGKVKLRGVQVGRVAGLENDRGTVTLRLDIDRDEVKFIPANVSAQIRATTVFGSKYVELVYPDEPSKQRLHAGAVIRSRNVTTEVNTVFENLTNVLKQIDAEKLNGVLSALAEGVRGDGDMIGQAVTGANNVLLQLNPRSDVIRKDWRSLKGFADAYGAAAQDIVRILDAASTASTAVTDSAADLDALLVSVLGLTRSGINLLGTSKDVLVRAVDVLAPTTGLLMKYNPELTCTLLGGKGVLDTGFPEVAGGHNGYSVILDVALLLGDDPYKYPENLPIIGAKGGPDGQPGCGSLPDVAKMYPHRYLVTNTGWGSGIDMRPNPGIGFPGYANYFPVTRGIPQPPSIRHPVGTAPGPIPYPGAPPYGAQLYGPDGTPLWLGLPQAPQPGRPPEPGPPPPGSEPFVPPYPAQMQPTCGVITGPCPH